VAVVVAAAVRAHERDIGADDDVTQSHRGNRATEHIVAHPWRGIILLEK